MSGGLIFLWNEWYLRIQFSNGLYERMYIFVWRGVVDRKHMAILCNIILQIQC